jgi:hypothetical protein
VQHTGVSDIDDRFDHPGNKILPDNRDSDGIRAASNRQSQTLTALRIEQHRSEPLLLHSQR